MMPLSVLGESDLSRKLAKLISVSDLDEDDGQFEVVYRRLAERTDQTTANKLVFCHAWVMYLGTVRNDAARTAAAQVFFEGGEQQAFPLALSGHLTMDKGERLYKDAFKAVTRAMSADGLRMWRKEVEVPADRRRRAAAQDLAQALDRQEREEAIRRATAEREAAEAGTGQPWSRQRWEQAVDRHHDDISAERISTAAQTLRDSLHG